MVIDELCKTAFKLKMLKSQSHVKVGDNFSQTVLFIFLVKFFALMKNLFM